VEISLDVVDNNAFLEEPAMADSSFLTHSIVDEEEAPMLEELEHVIWHLLQDPIAGAVNELAGAAVQATEMVQDSKLSIREDIHHVMASHDTPPGPLLLLPPHAPSYPSTPKYGDPIANPPLPPQIR
jgi:hypothetical protein